MVDDKGKYVLELAEKFEEISKVPMKWREVICDAIDIQRRILLNQLRYERDAETDNLRDYLDWLDTLTSQIMQAEKLHDNILKRLKKADRFKWYNPRQYLKNTNKTPEEILKELEWGTN